MVWELPYKVLDIRRVFLTNIGYEWYGNPRYVVLSRFQIRCYWVDTFPNLAVLPKMVLKSRWWKSQSCPIWMVRLLPDMKFRGESDIKVPCPGSCCAYPYTQNGVGDTRMGSGDHLWLGWFKLHLDYFFKEILNLKREIDIYQIIMLFIFILIYLFIFIN